MKKDWIALALLSGMLAGTTLVAQTGIDRGFTGKGRIAISRERQTVGAEAVPVTPDTSPAVVGFQLHFNTLDKAEIVGLFKH